MPSEFKGDIKGPFRSNPMKDTFSKMTERRNYHKTLRVKKVLTFFILSTSLCQAITQGTQPLLQISHSWLICDVIPAIDL